MTKYLYSASITALFEMQGENNEAQTWALQHLEPLGTVSRIDVTKWVDVYKNEPIVMVRADGTYNKFSLNAEMYLEVDGGYADAQKLVVDALKAGEGTTHMNIQRVCLTRSVITKS